jgi:predicted ATPase
MDQPSGSKRLSSAANELKIRLIDLVKFLEKKGHVIEAKPTTKLTDEQYKLLKDEFQDINSSFKYNLGKKKEHFFEEPNKIDLNQPYEVPINLDLSKLNLINKINLDHLNQKQLQETHQKEIAKNEPIVKPILPLDLLESTNLDSIIKNQKKSSDLSSIGFENFRRFINFDPIEYGPITMLVGKNNSGKSTLVKALMLISNYLKSGSVKTLNFNQTNVEDVNIVTYGRAKSKLAMANYISFEWKANNLLIELKISGNEDNTIANVLLLNIYNLKDGFSFQLDPQESQITIELTGTTAETSNEQNSLLIKQLEVKEKNIKEKQTKIKYKLGEEYISLIEELKHIRNKIRSLKSTIKKDVVNADNFSLSSFYNLDNLRDVFEETLIQINSEYELQYHSIQGGKKPSKEFEHYKAFKDNKFKLEKAINEFNDLTSKTEIVYLGASLTKQSALFAIRDKKNALAQVVNDYKQLGILPGEEAHRFVLKWMNENEFDIGENFEIKMHAGEAYEVLIFSHGTSIPLADKGMGSIQAMLLILRLATIIYKKSKTDKDYTIVIEEPELNLHPALQSKLADLFHEIYSKNGIKLIIETHSEYLIRKTQLIVKQLEYETSPNENPFTVIYFDKDMKQWKMNYRTDGKFIDDFGPGFFDETRNIIKKMM